MPAGFASSTSIHSAAELWASGKYSQLAARFVAELVTAEASGDRSRVVESANDLACAHRAAGNHVTAAYFQMLSATTERDLGSEGVGRISATSMGNLACDAILSGKWAIAESLLWKSLLAELAAGNDHGIAADWANLGLLAGLMGDLDAAKQRLWCALHIHRRLRDRFHTGLDLWHLAQVFEATGDWATSRKLATRAATWFETVGNAAHAAAAKQHIAVNAAREAVTSFDARLN